jgi:hypothetical protein
MGYGGKAGWSMEQRKTIQQPFLERKAIHTAQSHEFLSTGKGFSSDLRLF